MITIDTTDQPIDTTQQQTEVGAALHAALALHGHTVLTPKHGDVVVLPAGMTLTSLKRLHDEWRDAPERRIGTRKLDDLASFIAYVIRFCDGNSVIYAQRSETAPTFTAVLDEHRLGGPAAEDSPRFRQDRASYVAGMSEPWKAWAAVDGKTMSQRALTTLIEGRILDIAEPPTTDDPTGLALIRTLGGTTAGPAELLALARSLKVKETSEVVSVNNVATGETEISFRSKLTNDADQPLQIPSCFSVAAPLFEGGENYRLWIRIQMAKKQDSEGVQKLEWTLTRYRPDLILDAGMTAMLAQVREQTGITVLLGKPE